MFSITQSTQLIANDIKLGFYNRLGKFSLTNHWTYDKNWAFAPKKSD
jgi:hypothetical protein